MCDCLSDAAARLRELNTSVVTTLFASPERVVLRTDQIQSGRGKAKAAALIATCCPFCGLRYQGEDPGLARILAERRRHLGELEYAAERDDIYDQAQLWNAAHGYLSTIGSYDMGEAPAVIANDPPEYWPWAAEHWKPRGSIEDLTRAGALIAAELTRRIRVKERFVKLLVEAAVAGGADRPYAEAQAEIELDEYLKAEGIEVGCRDRAWDEGGAAELAEELILRHLEAEGAV
jgi:hypothetical protein